MDIIPNNRALICSDIVICNASCMGNDRTEGNDHLDETDLRYLLRKKFRFLICFNALYPSLWWYMVFCFDVGTAFNFSYFAAMG